MAGAQLSLLEVLHGTANAVRKRTRSPPGSCTIRREAGKRAAAELAAGRIGCTVEEYRRRRAAGERWCCMHRRWEPASRFGRGKANPDGLQSACRRGHAKASASRRAKRAALRAQGVEVKLPGRRVAPPRDGDKRQAKARIQHLVRAGVLPHPDTLPCSRCDHSRAADGRRHFYVHTHGFGAEHHESVEVLCSICSAAFGRECRRAKATEKATHA